MNIHDFMVEEVAFGGTVHVATVGEAGAQIHWSGELHPGVKDELKAEDGTFPDWFAKREVLAIGAAKDGGLMIAVE